jgi:hypothetical protein
MISERDTRKHNHLRHQVSGGYGGKEIDHLGREVTERIVEFIQWLESKSATHGVAQAPVHLARPIQYLTVDIKP